MGRSHSINRQLVLVILVILVLTLVPILLVTHTAFTSLSMVSDEMQQQLRVIYAEHNRGLAATLDIQLQTIATNTRVFGTIFAQQDEDVARAMGWLQRNWTPQNSGIERIGILAPAAGGYREIIVESQTAGVYNRSSSRQYPVLPPELRWLQEVLTEHTVVWHVPPDLQAMPSVFVALPYANRFGEPIGVIWAEVPLESIHQISQQWMQTSRGISGYNILMTGSSAVLSAFYVGGDTATDAPELLDAEHMSNAPMPVRALMTPGTGSLAASSARVPQHPANVAIYTQEAWLPSTGWRLVSISTENLLPQEPSSNLTLLALGFLGSIAVLVGFVYWFVTTRISRPLLTLNRAAQEIGAGDMRYQIDFQDRRDEIGRLAQSLEDMKTNLSHSYEQLARWSRKLEKRVAERTQALEKAEREAQEVASDLRALYDESLVVVSEYRLQPLLVKFTQRLETLLNASYCGIWMVNEHKHTLKHIARDGMQVDWVLDIGEGIVGKVVQSRQSIMVDNYPNWKDRVSRPVPQEIHRLVCVPLMVSGRPIGAVEAARPEDAAPFSERDLRLMTVFANLVSPAMHNAQLYVQLDDLRREAERANQVKTRFLASVTHELRTPLNLVINNMDFMRVGAFGDVNDDQVNRLDQTIRSAEHLLYLINDLLDASKIEAGEMRLFIQPNDLYPVIEDSLASALAELDRMGKGAVLALTAEYPEELPAVPMDARRIRQVLINLLSNAVKFTEAGEVRLEVTVHEGYVRFVVSDTGLGISTEDQAKLFDVFTRAGRGKEMGIDGTGLGLPISKFLVEAHGGVLSVASEVNVGSTFTFTLPLRALPQVKSPTDTQIMPVLIPNAG